LVEEGLIGIQIRDPDGKSVAFRTLPANTTPTEDWSIEVTSIFSCDMSGDPKDTFTRGSIAYVKVRVRNNRLFGEVDVVVTITHCDIDSTPFFLMTQRLTVPAQNTVNATLEAVIDDWVSIGDAVAYANLYEYQNLPKDGGAPLCPEKTASYTIVESGGGASTLSNPKSSQSSSENSFSATFRLCPDAELGTYLISITAYYHGSTGFSILAFSHVYKMLEDLLINRVIDIYDIVIVAGAYGAKGGYPLWNPEVDIDPNGEIDIYDVVRVASNYGVTY